MSELSVRPAKEEDYGAIAAIYNEAIAQGSVTMDSMRYVAEDIEKIAQKMGDRETYLIAELADKVIGWGIIKRYSDRPGYAPCCETSVYFSYSATGCGYGKVLQTALIDKVKQLGYHHIVAKILAANQASVRFHERMGFETVGIQKEIGCINGIWHDVVIMQYLIA